MEENQQQQENQQQEQQENQQKEVENQDEKIKKLEQQLKQKEMEIAIQKAGLQDFIDFFAPDKDINEQINKLKSILAAKEEAIKQQIIAETYRPENHTSKNDTFAKAEKQGDVKGMIAAQLSKLFQ